MTLDQHCYSATCVWWHAGSGEWSLRAFIADTAEG